MNEEISGYGLGNGFFEATPKQAWKAMAEQDPGTTTARLRLLSEQLHSAALGVQLQRAKVYQSLYTLEKEKAERDAARARALQFNHDPVPDGNGKVVLWINRDTGQRVKG
jgi:hypothetical protein